MNGRLDINNHSVLIGQVNGAVATGASVQALVVQGYNTSPTIDPNTGANYNSAGFYYSNGTSGIVSTSVTNDVASGAANPVFGGNGSPKAYAIGVADSDDNAYINWQSSPVGDGTVPNGKTLVAMTVMGDINMDGTRFQGFKQITIQVSVGPEYISTASLTVSGLEAGNVIMASNLIGSTVYSSANENVGSVNDVIFSKDGKIQAIIIGVGGFLGLGEKDVAVPLDRIQFSRDENNNMKYTVSASRQELEQAPAFDKTKLVVSGGGTPAPLAPVGGTSSTGQ